MVALSYGINLCHAGELQPFAAEAALRSLPGCRGAGWWVQRCGELQAARQLAEDG